MIKKRNIALGIFLSLFAVACASFSTNTFRVEQTAVNVAFASYQGYVTGISNGTINLSPQQSNSVRRARLEFAATIGVVDDWRAAYETNSQVKPQLQAALQSALGQSSNLVWLIRFYTTKP